MSRCGSSAQETPAGRPAAVSDAGSSTFKPVDCTRCVLRSTLAFGSLGVLAPFRKTALILALSSIGYPLFDLVVGVTRRLRLKRLLISELHAGFLLPRTKKWSDTPSRRGRPTYIQRAVSTLPVPETNYIAKPE